MNCSACLVKLCMRVYSESVRKCEVKCGNSSTKDHHNDLNQHMHTHLRHKTTCTPLAHTPLCEHTNIHDVHLLQYHYKNQHPPALLSNPSWSIICSYLYISSPTKVCCPTFSKLTCSTFHVSTPADLVLFFSRHLNIL